MTLGVTWIILTQGDRPDELRRAIDSIRDDAAGIIVVFNGVETEPLDGVTVVATPDNVGVPAGRAVGATYATTEVIAFLDDDACALNEGITTRIASAFSADATLGVVSFRIVDERGRSNRRHVPRIGDRSSDQSGSVANFLGGACAMSRHAYDTAGGYWGELFYAHEELDLAWRIRNCGFDIRYDADIVVEHPSTPISRHPEGWWRTGRNRVLIARRNLPLPIAAAHVASWLVIGLIRAPGRTTKRSYWSGWRAGWSMSVNRCPITWATVWQLCRLGRPPVF